jgi:hypothetical protein
VDTTTMAPPGDGSSTGPAVQDGGAIDRGCACRSGGTDASAWMLVALACALRRRHSFSARRSSASSRTHGASSG